MNLWWAYPVQHRHLPRATALQPLEGTFLQKEVGKRDDANWCVFGKFCVSLSWSRPTGVCSDRTTNAQEHAAIRDRLNVKPVGTGIQIAVGQAFPSHPLRQRRRHAGAFGVHFPTPNPKLAEAGPNCRRSRGAVVWSQCARCTAGGLLLVWWCAWRGWVGDIPVTPVRKIPITGCIMLRRASPASNKSRHVGA